MSYPTVTYHLDHIILAAPDLKTAMDDFEARTGTRPVIGGSHRGIGTQNALVSFGGSPPSYLEILSPDPDQNLEHTLGGKIAELTSPEVVHWSVRTDEMDRVRSLASTLGFEPSDIVDLSRTKPDGTTLRWKMLFLSGHVLGGLVPFFIDWRDCPHPALTAPEVGPMKGITLAVPESDKGALGDLVGRVDWIRFQKDGKETKLEILFGSHHGDIRMSSVSPWGVTEADIIARQDGK